MPYHYAVLAGCCSDFPIKLGQAFTEYSCCAGAISLQSLQAVCTGALSLQSLQAVCTGALSLLSLQAVCTGALSLQSLQAVCRGALSLCSACRLFAQEPYHCTVLAGCLHRSPITMQCLQAVYKGTPKCLAVAYGLFISF